MAWHGIYNRKQKGKAKMKNGKMRRNGNNGECRVWGERGQNGNFEVLLLLLLCLEDKGHMG